VKRVVQPAAAAQSHGQQDVTLLFTVKHFACFDVSGIVPLAKDQPKWIVMQGLVRDHPAIFQAPVMKCLSLKESDVKQGVRDFLFLVEGRVTFRIFMDETLRDKAIDEITSKLLKFNRDAASPIRNLAYSTLFKDSDRCVIFGPGAADAGRRLLGLFQMKEPKTPEGQLLTLVDGAGASWPLVILDSESGNGKTTACLSLASVVNDVTSATNELRCVLLMVLTSDTIGTETHDRRKKLLEEKFTEALDTQFQMLSTEKERMGFMKARWYIAIDEASTAPNLLRTLCVHRINIARYLEERFKLPANSVRILAAGTGSSGVVAPGCYPDHYKVVSLSGQKDVPPPGDCTEDVFQSHVHPNHRQRLCTPATRELWKKLTAVPYLAQAVENPRFAECLLERCHKVTEHLVAVQPAMLTRAMVDSVIGLSCIRFKELNGCEKLSSEAMMRVIAETIKYAIVPRLAAEVPHNLSTFGMGRDVAKAIPRKKADPTLYNEIKTDTVIRFPLPVKPGGVREYEECALVVPKARNRFQVSERQWGLMALGYGRGESVAHWEDFESAVAFFTKLNMIGLQGETVWQALLTLSGRPDDGDPFDGKFNVCFTTDAARAAAKQAKLSYTRLLCWTELSRLEKSTLFFDPTMYSAPESSGPSRAKIVEKTQAFQAQRKPVLGRLGASLSANLGAVIVNAPRASFADVIFLSRELVVLIQAKFYGENSSLDAGGVWSEIGEFGVLPHDPWLGSFLSELYSPLRIPVPLVVAGVMTTKPPVDLSTSSKMHENVLNTKGSVSPMIMQWEVEGAFVKGSRVRLRFPQPEAIKNRPDASVVGTVDRSTELKQDLLTPHFRLDGVEQNAMEL
jgi:hypothetical protein